MIQFIYAEELGNHPKLSHSMFLDRARQFKTRLGWDVRVDENGEERDQYDLINPLYVIVSDGEGRHEASMRLLPSTGRTMIAEHFHCLSKGSPPSCPTIWECTRFCVSPEAARNSAAKLMAAGGAAMKALEIKKLVGVFDKKMLGVYRLIGSMPEVESWANYHGSRIGLGSWRFSDQNYETLLQRSGLSMSEMDTFTSKSRLSASELDLLVA